MPDSSQYEPYKVYLADVSYFSGKLEAYLRYREVPFERIESDVSTLVNEVYPGTGLMKVPVVRMANGQWLKDTTPMLYWFDKLYPEASIIPSDPYLHFLSRLVEDYADEWLWRPALYYRWMYSQDFHLLGNRIANEVMRDWPLPKTMLGWYFGWRQKKVHLRGDGVRPQNEDHVRNTYLKLIDSMQSILTDTPYMLGSHPTLVDFGLFASMFRHFGLDPTPARIMRDRAPAVYEWLARLWNARVSQLADKQSLTDFSHTGYDYILNDIAEIYLPYLAENASAWSRKLKRFDFSASGVTYPDLPVSQYRVWCRGELQRSYEALPVDVKKQLGERLEGHDLDELMNRYGIVESGLEHEYQLPLTRKYAPARGLQKLKLSINGTPQDMPAANLQQRQHD